jgi:hypothetical protein
MDRHTSCSQGVLLLVPTVLASLTYPLEVTGSTSGAETGIENGCTLEVENSRKTTKTTQNGANHDTEVQMSPRFGDLQSNKLHGENRCTKLKLLSIGME